MPEMCPRRHRRSGRGGRERSGQCAGDAIGSISAPGLRAAPAARAPQLARRGRGTKSGAIDTAQIGADDC